MDIHVHVHQDPRLDRVLELLEKIMAAIDTLKTDIAALITEATTDITAAIAAAQAASQDPAIDALDTQVKTAITTLHTAAAGMGVPVPVNPTPPATPAP